MKATYVQRGETIEYKNTTESAINADDVVSLGSRIAVAGDNISKGETGILHTVGVFEIKKKESEVINQGTSVYYSETDGITATADSNIPAGYAFKSAKATDTTVYVKLLG